MTPAPKKRSRLRRILAILVTLILIYAIGIPTIGVFRARSGLTSAVASASAIRLEEYVGEQVLTTRMLASGEFLRVTEAVPVTWNYGDPGSVRLCFVPHHRILITDASTHRTTTFEVCFQCDQVNFTLGVIDAPAALHQPLRELFRRHDIPIRESYAFD